jgi:hypothetical protein
MKAFPLQKHLMTLTLPHTNHSNMMKKWMPLLAGSVEAEDKNQAS